MGSWRARDRDRAGKEVRETRARENGNKGRGGRATEAVEEL